MLHLMQILLEDEANDKAFHFNILDVVVIFLFVCNADFIFILIVEGYKIQSFILYKF